MYRSRRHVSVAVYVRVVVTAYMQGNADHFPPKQGKIATFFTENICQSSANPTAFQQKLPRKISINFPQNRSFFLQICLSVKIPLINKNYLFWDT